MNGEGAWNNPPRRQEVTERLALFKGYRPPRHDGASTSRDHLSGCTGQMLPAEGRERQARSFRRTPTKQRVTPQNRARLSSAGRPRRRPQGRDKKQNSRMGLASNGKPASETGNVPVVCRQVHPETTARWSSRRNTCTPFTGSRKRPCQTRTGGAMKNQEFCYNAALVRGYGQSKPDSLALNP